MKPQRRVQVALPPIVATTPNTSPVLTDCCIQDAVEKAVFKTEAKWRDRVKEMEIDRVQRYYPTFHSFEILFSTYLTLLQALSNVGGCTLDDCAVRALGFVLHATIGIDTVKL